MTLALGTRRQMVIDSLVTKWTIQRCRRTPASLDMEYRLRVMARGRDLWVDWLRWLESMPGDRRPPASLVPNVHTLCYALRRLGFARPYRSNGRRWQLGIKPLADGETLMDPAWWSEIF